MKNILTVTNERKRKNNIPPWFNFVFFFSTQIEFRLGVSLVDWRNVVQFRQLLRNFRK
jgi:hypothetical protein